jgi:hypothetical protein
MPDLVDFQTDTENWSFSSTAARCVIIYTLLVSWSNATVTKRINVMIDEDTWGFLRSVPTGERSRTINEALRAWVERRRRSDAVSEMESLRAQLPKVSTQDVARWIREDRGHGH